MTDFQFISHLLLSPCSFFFYTRSFNSSGTSPFKNVPPSPSGLSQSLQHVLRIQQPLFLHAGDADCNLPLFYSTLTSLLPSLINHKRTWHCRHSLKKYLFLPRKCQTKHCKTLLLSFLPVTLYAYDGKVNVIYLENVRDWMEQSFSKYLSKKLFCLPVKTRPSYPHVLVKHSISYMFPVFC